MERKSQNKKNKQPKKKIWDKTWERVFQTTEWGKYPPEELIRFTARNFYKTQRKKIKVLDLGCGTGSCSWYLAREGFSVYGIDGSKTAILKAKKRFKEEDLKGNFRLMDYINIDFPENYFDFVIDVCSIQCNPIKSVPTILNQMNKVLKSKGKMFSMLASVGTFNEPYDDKGYIHFYRLDEIKKFFKIFKILSIERTERTENDRKDKVIHWIVTCEKK